MKKGLKRSLISVLCIGAVAALIATGCGAKKETAPVAGTQTETQAGQMAGMANPWSDVSAQELNEKTGMHFNIPEGAENVIYRVLEDEKLAEVQFDLDGMHYTAREKATGGVEDISGYQGLKVEHVGEITDDYQIFIEGDDNGEHQVYLHYDIVPGVMKSLTLESDHELDGKFDIESIANQVFPVFQGNAG